MERHSTVIRARYAETDQMGIVHHANYYIWMEVARVDLCQAMGFRYRDMERDHGVLLAVVDSRCRYAGSAHFDDEVVIETRISEANSRMIGFCYDLSVDGRPIASGVTRHVFLNREMKPTRVPSQYRAFFGLPPSKGDVLQGAAAAQPDRPRKTMACPTSDKMVRS